MLTLAGLVQDIGGNDIQKQEIKEAVELPLTHHELYRQIGIDPPRGEPRAALLSYLCTWSYGTAFTDTWTCMHAGVLLWGPPGTGKTMLAKAVAHHTTAAFIRVVGSEFVQKYLGEVSTVLSESAGLIGCVLTTKIHQGPRMVRDVFRLAKENAPAIIFIDEVDAIATARFDAQTGADRRGSTRAAETY